MIEAVGVILTVCIVLVIGTCITLHGFCSLLLTKWASKTSHCVAQSRPKEECIYETKKSLEKYFGFHGVKVQTRFTRGIIHSEIEAKLLSKIIINDHMESPYIYNPLIKGSYDLEPAEYKRVK
jgi:hypothetical protein